MPKFSLVFAVALVSVFALSASAETPSFDCAKATYPDERTICFSAELSQLDNVANAGYEYVRRVSTAHNMQIHSTFPSYRRGEPVRLT
jgi:uncharacterized protein